MAGKATSGPPWGCDSPRGLGLRLGGHGCREGREGSAGKRWCSRQKLRTPQSIQKAHKPSPSGVGIASLASPPRRACLRTCFGFEADVERNGGSKNDMFL